MFGLENRGETLIFMLRHFDETVTILFSHFLRFGALKNLTGYSFTLYRVAYKWRMDRITYQRVNV